jgi:hypothetical protein
LQNPLFWKRLVNIASTKKTFFQCWRDDPAGSRLCLSLCRQLLEQLLKIRTVAQRIQVGVKLTDFKLGEAA